MQNQLRTKMEQDNAPLVTPHNAAVGDSSERSSNEGELSGSLKACRVRNITLSIDSTPHAVSRRTRIPCRRASSHFKGSLRSGPLPRSLFPTSIRRIACFPVSAIKDAVLQPRCPWTVIRSRRRWRPPSLDGGRFPLRHLRSPRPNDGIRPEASRTISRSSG